MVVAGYVGSDGELDSKRDEDSGEGGGDGEEVGLAVG